MRRLGLALVFFLAMAGAHAQKTNGATGKAGSEPVAEINQAEAKGPLFDASKPPPPTIADLVLLLQSYKPDPEKAKRLRAEMDKPIPDSTDAATLALAWHKRALAAEELGETEPWLAALEKGLTYARQVSASGAGNETGSYRRLRQDYAFALRSARGVGTALNSYEEFLAEMKGEQVPMLIPTYFHISMLYTLIGDLDRAKAAIDKAEAVLRVVRQRPRSALFYAGWAQFIERAKGQWYRRQGRLDDAERSLSAAVRLAETEVQNNETRRAQGMYAQPQDRDENMVDYARLFLAGTYIDQQRLDEAELVQREVLKASLKRNGRNSRMTGGALSGLTVVFIQRGRYAEALVLAGWADRALAEAGLSPAGPERLHARLLQANMLSVLGRYPEAVALYDDVRKVVSDDSRLEEGFSVATLNSVRAYIGANRFADALRDGEKLLQDGTRHYGADHYTTAEARAYRAMALHRNGRLDEARREFERAVAVLVDPTKLVGKQQTSTARTTRLRLILNEYLNVLVGNKGARSDKDVAEAFRVADVARWQTVQKAVAGSALRAAAGTPALGERIKRVQDADEELEAVYKNLISQRSAPPDRQLPAVIKAMEERIATLNKQQEKDVVEIRREFPQYDDLVNPRPADLATTRKALKANEALLSVYVTPVGSYVWATGVDGALQFHFTPRNAQWVAERVKRLRTSVDLTTGIAPDRLRFDLEAGNELYQELLAPVAAAWDKADTLLVVANESLGQIPFSLLPTEVLPLGKAEAGLPGSQFRQVPWLARKVAVAYLPSVSALVTLRAVPTSKLRRDPFIGFGDPDFAGGTTQNGKPASGTRNLKISHAPNWSESATGLDAVPPALTVPSNEVPTLTALPDTRDEILAIATALAADKQKDVFFGAAANRQAVTSADLKHRRVVAFATHGLVAGDLPGLDQPALALSPGAGKTLNDGLLKLDDILKLNLDADLVVLSACNTAAADGNGSEAVSGLGRGFFYAGSRAVLATHWPVETVSARDLVSHLFERYAKDGKMTRAQALRQAMLDLIDRDVARDGSGKAVNAYAHPAFWAPYALYGDPGR